MIWAMENIVFAKFAGAMKAVRLILTGFAAAFTVARMVQSRVGIVFNALARIAKPKLAGEPRGNEHP